MVNKSISIDCRADGKSEKSICLVRRLTECTEASSVPSQTQGYVVSFESLREWPEGEKRRRIELAGLRFAQCAGLSCRVGHPTEHMHRPPRSRGGMRDAWG